MESGLLLLKTAGALALVLGLLYGATFVLKRWGKLVKRPASQSMIEVLSKQSFGPRHHLILVKVTGQSNIMVGISPQNMSLLSLNSPATPGGDPVNEAVENK